MSHRMYPVGAKWTASNLKGYTAEVWLDERDGTWESWMYRVLNPKGVVLDDGNKGSYVMAMRAAKYQIESKDEKVRMSRVYENVKA